MKFSHIDEKGRAKMVDVTGKPVTDREAIAKGSVVMKPETIALIRDRAVPKGDVSRLRRRRELWPRKRPRN